MNTTHTGDIMGLDEVDYDDPVAVLIGLANVTHGERDLQVYTQAVIARGDAEEIARFAREVPRADAALLGAAIVEATRRETRVEESAEETTETPSEGHTEYIDPETGKEMTLYRMTEYAADHPDAVAAIQERVIASGDTAMMLQFAEYIPGADLERLQDEIIACGDDWGILGVARHFECADVPRLTDAVIDACRARHHSASTLVWFAADVPDADIARLQEEVIDSGDVHEMIAFARCVPGADIERLTDAVIATGNPDRMREFALRVPGANVARLQREHLDRTGAGTIRRALSRLVFP